MKLSLKLKPSLLGQYYEMRCDKYLVYRSVAKEAYKELGWIEPEGFKQTAAALAGQEWEQIILDRLKEDETCAVVELTHNMKLEDTVQVLKDIGQYGKTTYIYQACFGITPTFQKEVLSRFDSSDTDVFFSASMFPDFIKAEYIHSEGKYRLTVIDAKNASLLKMGAEIQIALYVEILKRIIVDENITNCFVNEDEGIVWNREKITNNRLEHVFNLHDARAEIENFFSERLTGICEIIDECGDGQQLQNELSCRISQKCEYCENFETCKKYCADKQSIRLMPYITTEAQTRVEELIADGVLKDDSISSVKNLLEADPDSLTDDCYYWKNIKNNLDAYVKGLRGYYAGKKERYPKVGSSISFPIGTNFSLLLTAQQDVNSGRVYAFAWLLKPGYGIDIFGEGLKNGWASIFEGKDSCPGKGTYYDSIVAQDNSDEEFDRVEREFVESIYEILEKINDYPDSKKRKLQCFVMDDYERSNIENTLFSMLEFLNPIEDQNLIEKVMTILFWMQGERLVTDADQLPENSIETPFSVITTEISRLYVLSEGVAYNLRKIASVFSPDFNFDEDTSPYFGVLTNVVEGTHIIDAWKEQDNDKKQSRIESLGRHLRRRLFVESAIIGAVQADNKKGVIHLSAWPTQYSMQKPKYPDYPEVARLDFENRFEQLLTYQEIRKSRISGIQNAIDNGSILQLEWCGSGNTYYILNSESYVGREWFNAFLCEDTPENRLQIMLLRDTDYTGRVPKCYSASFTVKDSDTIFYPTDFNMDYNFEDSGSEAMVDFVAKNGSGFAPELGKKYLFFEVYFDMNSKKTAMGISKLPSRLELLDPCKITGSTGLKFDLAAKAVCKKYWSPDKYTFSPSQEKAFVHLFENKMNVLQGPPASGKTDFISRALITLASYYADAKKKKLKIMVTAMSHSAIENVLLKLDKMLQNGNTLGINIYKVDRFDDAKSFSGKGVTVVDSKNLAKHMDCDEIQIIGMTSWAAYKAFHDEKTGDMRIFDMIVMDEASQIRAMDAFLNLECSDENTRFLLVGDDDQLPPIIGGKYKEIEGEKYIHGSIFRMYSSALGKDHKDIIRLSDNFRMNGILCKYPSLAIYGPEYKAYNDSIKNQHISLKQTSKDEILSFILDEDYPLVFCELSGVSREQKEAEVEMVTSLVHELWQSQMNAETKMLAQETGNFWRDYSDGNKTYEGACGIITPHHEHINRLKTSISNDLGLDRKEIFIGTVDKLQGKERKTVIVSYGVSENEKISSESEFIFSRNRFNVSITRGKAKTIVFLSDVIAEPNLTTNIMAANDPALKKGIDFIHEFVSYMKNEQDGEVMESADYPYVCGDVSMKVWKKKLLE